MGNLEEIAELAGSCYYNMLRSCIEGLEERPKPKEAVGDLLGKRIKEKFICLNAYPIITAHRTPSGIYFYDEGPIDKVRELDKALNQLGGLGTYLLGSYHSHVTEDINSNLGRCDIKGIERELKKLNKEYWIEILLRLKSRQLARPKKIGEYFIEYKRKLRVIRRPSPLSSYDIIISAYKINRDLKIKELKVKRRKIKVRVIE